MENDNTETDQPAETSPAAAPQAEPVPQQAAADGTAMDVREFVLRQALASLDGPGRTRTDDGVAFQFAKIAGGWRVPETWVHEFEPLRDFLRAVDPGFASRDETGDYIMRDAAFKINDGVVIFMNSDLT